jgi:hypothetical protein
MQSLFVREYEFDGEESSMRNTLQTISESTKQLNNLEELCNMPSQKSI